MFHLSFILDELGYNRINLVSFYELSKLDNFIIKNFRNTYDVRKKYQQDISEFCLVNRELIEEENKRNNHNWTGSIAIIAEERDKNDHVGLFHKIPIIYKNDLKLLSKDECLIKIKNKLKNPNIIKVIYQNKKIMLSQNERELYIKDSKRSDNKYLKSCIGNFYTRISHYDDELLYYYCRSLMNIFELNELTIWTKFGSINHINKNIPHDMHLNKEKIISNSNDIYLNRLISNNNYEELFNIYSIDEINRDTDMFEKGRI